YFHFFSPGTPRDLHSFPTRRSSDLGGGLLSRRHAGSGRREWARLYELLIVVLVRTPDHERTGVLEPADGGDDPALRLLDHAPALDRKSTRLNSSHRTISYAVFCLKK